LFEVNYIRIRHSYKNWSLSLTFWFRFNSKKFRIFVFKFINNERLWSESFYATKE